MYFPKTSRIFLGGTIMSKKKLNKQYVNTTSALLEMDQELIH